MLGLIDGTPIPIYLVKIGDMLQDGSIITSTIVLSRQTAKMYYLNGVFVTGTHLVYYNKTWIQVENHPDSIYLPEYIDPIVYCVNTDTGILKIGHTIFTDWNEMLPSDFVLFPSHHSIRLKNTHQTIDKCQLGDVLYDNRVITGLVTSIHNEHSGIWYHLYYDL